MSRAYLDHASTSPLRPAAAAAIRAALDGPPLGDPGRIHHEGMTARVALEEARERVAAAFGARGREVVLTSGATESIAAASFGARARAADRGDGPGHVVLPAVEHSAVREWAARGPSSVVGVDATGRVDPDALLRAVRPDTALVHVQWGNHEVGTLQPVRQVVEACRERGVLVHVDAAQAAGRVPIDFVDLGADLLSISGHKFGAPAGTGALLVRRGVRVPPLLVGGDQERARRAGTEDVVGAVALAAAAAEAVGGLDEESARCRALTDRIRAWAVGAEGLDVVGAPADGALPHLVCLTFADLEPQPVLLGLDRAGVAVHSGSSCSSESLEPSPVLEAMGVDAHRSLRVSVGWSSADADVDLLLEALPRVLADLRSLRS
ncbi:cysteine desulfurase family protein [Dermatobacter hominis]|uniref:cysteine desulfurase family protein n=1 Tax=Dermatobacter hominis TaxID=2884263 RepID=UPI001D0F758D|nr:aminotransferase class V-fold PLP-dependent enzyme [Dermatobacter hominis]UDY37273.1 aminotransferase class V-fold PLP-dependent enzyme [Dermatobacter hominis]